MTSVESQPLIVAIKAARAAGDIILAEYYKEQAVREKIDHSVATETDTSAEKIILETIQAVFPDDAIFSEEIGMEMHQGKPLWIIDPLDGTSNFVRHLPGVTVSIALVKNGRLEVGVVYDPLHDKLYAAQASRGTQVNGQEIHVSEQSHLDKSLVSFGRGNSDRKALGPLFDRVNAAIHTPRIIGSTALGISYVASGQNDAHLNINCYLYDCAAAALIAQEAGATIVDFSGQPWQPDLTDPTSTSNLIVANATLAQTLATLINP